MPEYRVFYHVAVGAYYIAVRICFAKKKTRIEKVAMLNMSLIIVK